MALPPQPYLIAALTSAAWACTWQSTLSQHSVNTTVNTTVNTADVLQKIPRPAVQGYNS